MPILAVNDISTEAMEVIFKQDLGELVNGSTSKRSRFVKKKGVHVVYMYYKKDQCLDNCGCDEQPVVGQPGTP